MKRIHHRADSCDIELAMTGAAEITDDVVRAALDGVARLDRTTGRQRTHREVSLINAVTRPRNHQRKPRSGLPPQDRDASAPGPESAATRAGSSTDAAPGTVRPRTQRPVLRFLLIFGGLMVLFYVVFLLPPDQFPTVGHGFTAYLGFYARMSGAVLTALGHRITVSGQTIASPEYTVRVVRGCDAMEATVLFIAAVLASPVALRFKLPALLGGILLLGVINLTRIVSLFYVGIHFPRWFDTVHFVVWQPVFILLAVCLWLIWATWAKRRMRTHAAD